MWGKCYRRAVLPSAALPSVVCDAVPIPSFSRAIAAAGLAIDTTGFAADLEQLPEALNVPMPEVSQVQVEHIESE